MTLITLPKTKKPSRIGLFCFFSCLLAFSSCDDESPVGLNIQPDDSKLSIAFTDTLTITSQTEQIESIRTDNLITQAYTTNSLIGTYIDPVFGQTSAALSTQLRLNNTTTSLTTLPTVDSVVLELIYDSTSFYGTAITGSQTFNVYEISEAIESDAGRTSTEVLQRETTDLANGYTFTPNNTSNSVRIPLSIAFGESILNPTNAASLTSVESFQEFKKGLYITTENTSGLNSGEGNILQFEMDNASTQLHIYYKDPTTNTSVDFTLSFNSVSRYSNFIHDYSALDLSKQNDIAYLQSMGGTRIKIDFPSIHNLSNEVVSVNGATLVFKLNSDYPTTQFSVPTSIIALGDDGNGATFALPDSGEGDSYFDGTYNATDSTYSINIARYIQQVIGRTIENNGLYIEVKNQAIAPGRVILGGGSTTNPYPIKLNLTYTNKRI